VKDFPKKPSSLPEIEGKEKDFAVRKQGVTVLSAGLYGCWLTFAAR